MIKTFKQRLQFAKATVGNIGPTQFYKLGMWSFIIIAVCNMINYVYNWSMLNIPGKISTGAGIIFNVVLILFFKSMLKSSSDSFLKGEPEATDSTDKDLINAFKEV